MSPVQHPVSGPVLAFGLSDEMRRVRDHLATGARSARTLVKNGTLRATLIGVAPAGALAPHSAAGPLTVQVLEGSIELEAEGQVHTLAPGSLLALDANIVHAVRSPGGGIFLLTLSEPPAA